MKIKCKAKSDIGRDRSLIDCVRTRVADAVRGQGYCVVGLLLVTASMRSLGRWSARLVARAMLGSPLLRWNPIAVLRSVANTAGPLPVRLDGRLHPA
jgi:hypothetical protein